MCPIISLKYTLIGADIASASKVPKALETKKASKYLCWMQYYFDLFYVPQDVFQRNIYKYVSAGIHATPRYKVTGALITKDWGWEQFKKMVVCLNTQWFFNVIMDLSLKMMWQGCLKKHSNDIQIKTNYNHTQTIFVELVNKAIAKQLFKIIDMQEPQDPQKSIGNLG